MQGTYIINFSTFKQNRCPDGVVNIAYIPLLLKGGNIFISNYGSALRVSSHTYNYYPITYYIQCIDNRMSC